MIEMNEQEVYKGRKRNDNGEGVEEYELFTEPYSHARLETLRVAGNKRRGAQPCRMRLSAGTASFSEIASVIGKLAFSLLFRLFEKKSVYAKAI